MCFPQPPRQFVEILTIQTSISARKILMDGEKKLSVGILLKIGCKQLIHLHWSVCDALLQTELQKFI